MKYSKEFERDLRFYLSNRHIFNFDGKHKAAYTRKSIDVFRIPTEEFKNLKNNVGIDKYFAYNLPIKTFNERFPNQQSDRSIGTQYCWYFVNKTEPLVVYDKEGVDGIYAFYEIENGKVLPTKHPKLLQILLKCKGSVNLNIKMWKEDYNNLWDYGRLLPEIDVLEIIKQYNCPDWVYKAITGNDYTVNIKPEEIKETKELPYFDIELCLN